MQSLNGTWKLATDPNNVGREKRWYAATRDDAVDAPVPGCIQEVIPRYHGVAWYWTEVTVAPNAHPGGRTLLRFWAVDYLADVWVNGVHVGGHEGGETPFILDVDEAIKHGRKNVIAVRVLSPTHEPIDGISLAETPHMVRNYPLQPGHWRCLSVGGIVDDVELIHAPALRVADLYVRPDWQTGEVQFEVAVESSRTDAAAALVQLAIAPAMAGTPADTSTIACSPGPGTTTVRGTLRVENHRLWDVNDPYLYLASTRVFDPSEPASFDEASTRCGFRDFRLDDGHFRLNGRRIFLRSAHIIPEYPVGLLVPRDPKLELLDAAYIKASGMNCVRYIAQMPRRQVLDLCDEMGIMMYQEHLASWGMADSPRTAEHYDRSCREMILRDRNHPSVTIWGMLNETHATHPVVAHASQALSLVRSLDPDRLVAFNSGSWDFADDPKAGCMSNPGSDTWDVYLGGRADGKTKAEWDDDANIGNMVNPAAGDIHLYPPLPQPLRVVRGLRRMGRGVGPVFVSEYGAGSAIDLARLPGQHQQAGAGHSEATDFFAKTLAMFLKDWKKWGMAEMFGRPEDYFRHAQSRMANLRYEGITALRANPHVIGYSMTALRDVGHSGEGMWTVFRELKPGQMDAVSEAYAPLRWCLFAEPDVIYSGGRIQLEAVLANEDVLPPGEYPVRLEIFGPDGKRVWSRRTSVSVPAGREPLPLAIPVFSGRVTINGPEGGYRFTATVESGAAPRGRPALFHIEDEAVRPDPIGPVVLWGRNCLLRSWLRSRGVEVHDLEPGRARDAVILVADNALGLRKDQAFPELYRQIREGAVAVFLSPAIFRRADDIGHWLPEEHEDCLCTVPSDLYIADNWAKAHPAFDCLPAGGFMDDSFFRNVIPTAAWNGASAPDEAIAGANRCGMHPSSGYVSGLFLSRHRLGDGCFYLNTLRVLENLGKDPVADRLLLNLINCAGEAAETRGGDA